MQKRKNGSEMRGEDKMRRTSRWKAGLLILASGLLIGGCGSWKTAETEVIAGAEGSGQESESLVPDGAKAAGDYVEKETKNAANYVIRDRDSLYEKDDPASIVTMYLTVRKGNEAEHTNHTWTEVNAYSKYYYEENNIPQYAVEGILQIGDANGPVAGEFGYGESVPNATVQIRGQTSTRREQKNYKVRIKDNKGRWRDQQTIALNKHVGDPLRFKNKLAYDLMKDIPQMMSARTQFVHLYVKDETEGTGSVFEDYGLYTQVEQINKRYLTNHGLDKNGQLYKINYFEYFRYEDAIKLATDETYDLKEFETYLEVKGSNDHSKLIEMLDAVNDYSIPIEEVVNRYFDVDNLFYWMSFHLLTGNGDTNARNFYLYSPTNLNKWYIISWDNDASFNHTENLIKNYSETGSWEQGISRYWGVVLYQRMFKLEKYRDRLTEIMGDMYQNYLTKEHVGDLADTYAAIVKPYVFSMPDLLYESLTESQYDTVVEAIPDELEENYNSYLESLKKPMPFFQGIPAVKDGKLVLSWDAAYDFRGENVTYTFELSQDPLFGSVLDRKENLRIPETTVDVLPEGQYFYRVRARNESGYEQDSFDYYVTSEGKIYGTKCFYVLSDGTIKEDIYVE